MTHARAFGMMFEFMPTVYQRHQRDENAEHGLRNSELYAVRCKQLFIGCFRLKNFLQMSPIDPRLALLFAKTPATDRTTVDVMRRTKHRAEVIAVDSHRALSTAFLAQLISRHKMTSASVALLISYRVATTTPLVPSRSRCTSPTT